MRGVLLFSLLTTSSLMAWGRHRSQQSTVEEWKLPQSFPLSDEQAWFVTPSYLIMIPDVDSTDYGKEYFRPNQLHLFTKVKRPDFNWGSGARLAIGKYIPNHDLWDLSLVTSYLYTTGEVTNRVTIPVSIFDLNPAIAPGWAVALNDQDVKTQLHWRMNYFTWDLQLRRLFTLTSSVDLSPFLGLRFPLIYQTYDLRPTAIYQRETEDVAFLERVLFRIHDTFWGGGPRLGFDLKYEFQPGWSFVGQLAGSFIYSNQSIKEKATGNLLDAVLNLVPTTYKYHQNITALRTNVEIAIGMGWEKWVRNETVRIHPSVVFEMSQWFDLIHWSYFSSRASSVGFPDFAFNPVERTGDLGLMGFSINLQIDF